MELEFFQAVDSTIIWLHPLDKLKEKLDRDFTRILQRCFEQIL